MLYEIGVRSTRIASNPPFLDHEEVKGEEVEHRKYGRQPRRGLDGTERDAARGQRLENLFADP